MAPDPARSESSRRLTLPLAMSAPPILQPDGSAAMQGSMAADGPAWALRISEWPVPQLGEGHVDEQQLPAADHEVARLDVTGCGPGIPRHAGQRQPLVDDLVVDRGLADLGGILEELGGQQVLTLGCDLDNAVGPGRV